MSLVTAFVAVAKLATGLSNRLYPDGDQQSPPRPYATYAVVGENFDNHLDGVGALKMRRIQVDIFANTALEAEAISDDMTVRLLAATTLAAVPLDVVTDFDPETKLHMHSVDYSVHYSP